MTCNIITYEVKDGTEVFFCNTFGLCRLTFIDGINAAFLSTLAVDNMHRKQGIATLLVQKAEQCARERQRGAISLQVERYTWMRDWYLRLGYVEVAEGYEQNHVLMTKIL